MAKKIQINGIIGIDVTKDDIMRQAEGLAAEDDVVVHITSKGGSVIEGHAIHSVLAPLMPTTIIEGGAMSAGTLVSQAAAPGKRQIRANAMMMVHEPTSGGTSGGTIADHEQAISALTAARDAILETYTARTGRKESDLRRMMAETTWMTAQQAMARGFVDVVVESTSAEADPDFLELAPIEIVNELQQATPAITQPSEDDIVANETPKPATVREIEAICNGGVDPSFVVAQLKNEATVEQVQAAYAADLVATNAALVASAAEDKARIEELEAKLENAPKTPALGGTVPVTTDTVATSEIDPIAAWNEAIDKQVARGKSLKDATRIVGRNSELRNAMVKAYNEEHGRADVVAHL